MLIVEDDEEIRDCLQDVLQDFGYEASTAANGSEALAQLRSLAVLPHIILLDLLMPVMDGEQFRKEQLADVRLRAIPTIVLSANAQLATRAARMGVESFLAKPVELHALRAALTKHTPGENT